MKIGLTGASGTGKTTLAKELSKKYNLRHITNVARTSPGAEFGMLTSNASLQNQLIIMNTLKFWAEQDAIVSDRIVADAYIYLKMAGISLDMPTNNFVLNQLYSNLSDYDVIIYCPLYEWDVESEGVRNLDSNYQHKFSEKLECILFDYCPNLPMVMKNEPIQERLIAIDKFLTKKNLI